MVSRVEGLHLEGLHVRSVDLPVLGVFRAELAFCAASEIAAVIGRRAGHGGGTDDTRVVSVLSPVLGLIMN